VRVERAATRVGGCAPEDDPAAVVAGAGAKVDDPVGVCHDGLVVLDHDHRLAGVDEPVEQAEQLLDVGEVEAGGRLVQDVDAALLGQVGGQVDVTVGAFAIISRMVRRSSSVMPGSAAGGV